MEQVGREGRGATKIVEKWGEWLLRVAEYRKTIWKII